MEPGQILIAEDEPVIGFALEEMVEALGWNVTAVVTRVGEALQLLEREAPDVAILEFNLHGEQSYPIADKLTELGVPYVFATGYGDASHPERHRHAPTLSKPHSVDQVRAPRKRPTSELLVRLRSSNPIWASHWGSSRCGHAFLYTLFWKVVLRPLGRRGRSAL